MDKEKKNLLIHLLKDTSIESVLIFTRTKYGADKLARVLTKAGNYITENEKGETQFINHRNRLTHYPTDYCNKVRCITGDSKGRLWIGTTHGLLMTHVKFTRPEDVQFKHYFCSSENQHTLSNNDIWQEERHNVFHFCQRVTNYLIMKRSSIRQLSHCIMANILWMRIY